MKLIRKKKHTKTIALDEPNITDLEGDTMREWGYELKKISIKQIDNNNKRVETVWRR